MRFDVRRSQQLDVSRSHWLTPGLDGSRFTSRLEARSDVIWSATAFDARARAAFSPPRRREKCSSLAIVLLLGRHITFLTKVVSPNYYAVSLSVTF